MLACSRTQIYGLVVSVLIAGDLKSPMTLFQGLVEFGAGISVGLAGLSAGFAIGIVGDAGVRGTAQQPRLYVGMILILIFAEVRPSRQNCADVDRYVLPLPFKLTFSTCSDSTVSSSLSS